MSFQGKVVIITGASSGIGAATAIKFAEEGAQVSLVARNVNKLNKVAEKCPNHLVLVADISKDEDAERIVSETVKHFGRLDILVNNAGTSAEKNFLQDDVIRAFDQVMATNLRAPVLLSHLAAPHLVKTKGNIVNISSIDGIRALSASSFTYSTSKAALDHFTRSIAGELAASGVRINCVNPGPVKTDIIESLGLDEPGVEAFWDEMKKITALNRISEAGEVADMVLFLASDKAIAITGSLFVVDNGILIKSVV